MAVTILSIKPQEDYSELLSTCTSEQDIVIYYYKRIVQCAGFLKDGECQNGECSDCVRFVLRVAGGNLENISSIRDYIKANSLILQYYLPKAIEGFEQLPFSIEVFVNNQLYLEAIRLQQKLYRKLQFYSFVMAQNRRTRQIELGVPVDKRSTACQLPSDTNRNIYKFL